MKPCQYSGTVPKDRRATLSKQVLYGEPVAAAGVISPPLNCGKILKDTGWRSILDRKASSSGRELTPGLRTEAAVDGETVLVLNHLFLEQAEGYVKTPEKSTFRPSTIREVFEHCTESYSASEVC